MPEAAAIILFDGVCNLCNGFVQFIIPRDPRRQFRFCSLQSDSAQTLLRETNIDPDALTTVVLLEQHHIYTESTAVLRIARRLGGVWALMYGFIIIPPFIRNGVYRMVARSRYRLFGKRNECLFPSGKWQDRFLP